MPTDDASSAGGTTSPDDRSVDPSAIADQAGFGAALTALRTRLGLTVRDVSRAAGVPNATVGGYFSGRHLPPLSQRETFEGLLRTLQVPDDQMEQWWSTLTRLRRGPRRRVDGPAPYRGLEHYGVGESAWFFGRDDLTRTLTDECSRLLNSDPTHTGPRVLIVVGASGSGKSSLLQAGLMAQFVSQGTPAAAMAPGTDPVHNLQDALDQLGESDARLLVVDQFEELFDARVEDAQRRRFLTRILDVASADAPTTVLASALRADFYGRAVAQPELVPVLGHHQVVVGPMSEEDVRAAITEPARRWGTAVERQLVDLLLQDLRPTTLYASAGVSSLPLLSHALLATWQHAKGGPLTVADYLAVGGIAGAVRRSADQIYDSLGQAQKQAARRLFAQLVTVDRDGVVTKRRIHHNDLVRDPSIKPVIEAFLTGRILTSTEDTIEISHEVLLTAWPRLRDWIEEDLEEFRLRRRVQDAANNWAEQDKDDGALARSAFLEEGRALLRSPGSGLTDVERCFLERSIEVDDQNRRVEQTRVRRMRTLLAVAIVLALAALVLAVYLGHTAGIARDQRQAAQQARNVALSRQVALESDNLAATSPALAGQLALAAYHISPTVDARSSLLEATGRAPATRLLGASGTMIAVPSPDGQLLAKGDINGLVTIWRLTETGTPTLLATIKTGATETPLYAGAFNPDSRYFITGGQGRLAVIDLAAPGRPKLVTSQLAGPSGTVYGLAFDPSTGILAAATSDQAVFRWRLTEDRFRPLPTLRQFTGSVQALAYSRSGLLATATADGHLGLWHSVAGSGMERVWGDRVTGGGRMATSVALSPNGTLLAAGDQDGDVRIWQITKPARPRLIRTLRKFKDYVNGVAFSPDGTMLAAAASGARTAVWSTQSWDRIRQYQGTANMTTALFTADNRELVVSAIDGTARLYQLAAPLVDLGHPLYTASYQHDGSNAYVPYTGAVAELDTSIPGNLRIAHTFTAPPSAGSIDGTARVTPDGRTLVAGTLTGNLVVWHTADARRDEPVEVVKANSKLIESIDVSANGDRLVATGDGGEVVVYDITPAGLRKHAETNLGPLPLGLGAAISADGNLAAIGTGDHRLLLYRVGTNRLTKLATINDFTNYIYAVAFSPSQPVLAGGSSDKTVRLYNVSDPARPDPIGKPLRDAGDATVGLAFSPDGRNLAAASHGSGTQIWQVSQTAPAALTAKLTGNDPGIVGVAYDPTGSSVLTGGNDGAAQTWYTHTDDAARLLCAWSGTPITRDEWAQYVPGAAYRPPCT